MNYKVLIIDDNEELQERLNEYLTHQNFSVKSILTGVDSIREIEENLPDIIILDIMLPEKDGLDVLKDIRAKYKIPVLMLTARGDDLDRILGLELGADDYLPKPFNPRELLARLKAILRRSIDKNDSKDHKKIKLDKNKHTIIYAGKTIELSSVEFRIMQVFINNANIILSRERIMELAHSKDYLAFDRSIDIQISRLRTKLNELTGTSNWIRTHHGSGYSLMSKL